MAKVSNLLKQLVSLMMETFIKTKDMEKGHIHYLTVQASRDNGQKAKSMDMENMLVRMEKELIRVSTKKVNNKVMGQKHAVTDQTMKECGLKDLDLDQVGTNILTGLQLTENFIKLKFQDSLQ